MSIFRDGDGDLRIGWEMTLFFTVIITVCLVLLAAVFYGPVRWGCRNQAEAMGREWRWSLTTQCLVQSDDGRFVPLDNLRITNEEEG